MEKIGDDPPRQETLAGGGDSSSSTGEDHLGQVRKERPRAAHANLKCADAHKHTRLNTFHISTRYMYVYVYACFSLTFYIGNTSK